MARIATLLALVSALALCQAVPVFIPSGKEIIYNYRALIDTGTYEPAPYASQFILNGKLHMQKIDDKHVVMKLTDLTYKLYNGELIHGHEHEEKLSPLPLSDEVHDLLEPFIMTYDEHGHIQKIITDKKDRKFSRDMKKGIGSLMQLDMNQLKLDAKENYVFSTWENYVYGKVHVRYSVIPEHNEMIIEKMLDLQKQGEVRPWKAYVGTTDNDRIEEYLSRDSITTASHKTFTLIEEDNHHVIKEINSQGSTYMAVMKGNSESQFMLVNQDLVWSEMIPIATPMTKPEHELEEDLKFELGQTEDDEAITDLSFGRSTMKMEDYEKLIYSILEEGVKYMDLKHLKMESPDMKSGHWMNRLMRIMSMLDLKHMEHMFVTMQEKTAEKDQEMFEIFQEMMPLVGTRASVLLMRNLIRKQKVSDGMAMSMLIQMPFHLRMPSGKLLTELEDMIHLENVNSTIQKTATLTFASMVSKVYKNKILHLGDSVEEPEWLEKYVQKFMNLLKNAQDYSSQYLYMNALYNIEHGNVEKYLEPYVTGTVTKNRHLRYLAMCASHSEVIKDSHKVFEIYWPIFADSSLHLELRAGAYFTIMATKPSKTKLMDIYWVLKNDPCPELYHMHWSFLRSMEFTTDIELEGYKHMATEMLNFMRKPMHHTLTGHYQMDYMDPNFGFGSLLSATIMSTNTSKAMYMDFSSNIYNLPVMDGALWVKIEGLDPSVIRETPVQIDNIESNVILEELIRMVMTMKNQKNLHFEYSILYNNKIIIMDYADHSTIENQKGHVLASMELLGDTQINFEQVTQSIYPNDLGLATIVELVMPSLSHHTFDITDDKTEGSTVKVGEWKYMGSSQIGYGMAYYNPIPDVWHGIERFQTNEMVSAMDFKIGMTKDFKLKMTINKQNDDSMDKFALRNYATSMVYIYKDLHNELHKSSKNSHHFTKVSRGEDYRKSKILFEHDCPHTGLLFQVAVFDTKKHISRRTMTELWQDLTQRYYKNYQTMPFGYMLLTLTNSMHYMFISPEVGSFGFLIRATPSKKYPVDHIDISLRATLEHIKDKDHHLPNKKLNTRFTWATKSKDNKELHNWDTNAILDMNPGHTLNQYKIHFSMGAPDEKEFKMCIVGMRKWLNNKMIGHMNMTMGHTDDTTTCVDNEGIIEIDMKGELSDEQQNMINKKLTYDECLPVHMHEPLLHDIKVDYEEDIDCTLKQTSLKKFEYDIKTTGMSEKTTEIMRKIGECMKGWMMPFYSHEKTNIALDDHTMKLIIDYPVGGHEMNMVVSTPKTKHIFKEVPTTMTKWMGFQPESYHYTSLAIWMHKMGMTESCMIVDQHLYNDNFEVTEISKDWTMVVHTNPNIPTNHTLDIFVKQMDDTKAMGLRMKIDEKIMEILPEGETYKITWDNKPLTVTKGSYLDEDIFSIGMMHDKHHTIIMHLYNFGLYMDYDGEQIRMDKRKMNMHLTGPCFTR